METGNPSVDGPGTLSYYEAPMDGEYILEVVAEGTNGLKGRSGAKSTNRVWRRENIHHPACTW